MRKDDRKLAWAGIVVLAVMALELAWLLLIGPAKGSPACGTGNTPQCDLPWWDSAAFWTAAFTFFLTVSTGLLWWQTRRLAIGADDQSGKMEKSIAAAERSAAAAERAAEASERNVSALIGAERPVLWVSSLTVAGEGSEWFEKCWPTLTVKNCGRTSVIITQVIVNMGVGLVPTIRPELVIHDPYPDEIAIEPGKEHGFFDHWSRQNLDKKSIEAWLVDPAEMLYFFGSIKYRDFSGPHEQGWMFMWALKSKHFIPFYQLTEYYEQK